MLTQIGGYKNEVGGVVHAPDTELDFFLSFIGSGELSGHLCACAPAIILMISPGENYHAPSREQQIIRDLVEAHSVNSIT